MEKKELTIEEKALLFDEVANVLSEGDLSRVLSKEEQTTESNGRIWTLTGGKKVFGEMEDYNEVAEKLYEGLELSEIQSDFFWHCSEKYFVLVDELKSNCSAKWLGGQSAFAYFVYLCSQLQSIRGGVSIDTLLSFFGKFDEERRRVLQLMSNYRCSRHVSKEVEIRGLALEAILRAKNDTDPQSEFNKRGLTDYVERSTLKLREVRF